MEGAGLSGVAGGRSARAAGTFGAAAALSAATLVYVLHPFVPNLPVDSLDAGWESTLGEMADRGAVWGRDLAFTYGPASPLVSGYLNGAFLDRTLPLCVAVAVAAGAAAARLVAAPARGRRASLAATATLGLALAACGADAVVIVIPFLLVLAVLAGRGTSPALVGAFGAAVMGATAMAKMSYPLSAAPLFLLGDGAALLGRRVPPFVLPFIGGIALGALAYGQPIAGLPTYLRMQGEVVAGYAAAMSQPGPAWELALFAAAAAALLAAAAWGAGARGGAAWAAPAALATTLLVLVKAGFVRHDIHALTAWQGAALLATALAWGWVPAGQRGAAPALSAAALLVLYVYGPTRSLAAAGDRATIPAVGRFDGGVLAAGPAQVEAAARLAWDPAGTMAAYRADKAQAFAAIAAARPLGALAGPVDLLPSEQTRAWANGLELRPRPSFQGYSTYTAGLAEANRRFFEGPRAPRWFLFGPEDARGWMTIDGRFPNLTEGALWLDLLSRYRPDHRIGDLLALERRPVPVPVPLGDAVVRDVALGAELPVADAGPVWATIDLRPNLLGRLAALLFRPPLVDVSLRFADGGERRFRFLPSLGQVGFLLSPLVTNASDFAVLADGRGAAPGRRVIAVSVEAGRAAAAFYEPRLSVALRAIDVAALREGGSPSAPSGSAWERLAAAAPPGTVEAGGRIAAQAPASLSLPAEGLGRLALAYGIDGVPGTDARACFAVVSADGLDAPLWRSCLDPGRVPADRGPRTVSLAVPAGTTEIELRTSCDGPCDAAPAYWGRPADDPRP